MNKILKDLVVKSRSMMGFDAPYMLGYDCHGLPIELKVDRELGPKKREMSVADFRRACRAYATRFIDVMSDEFQRLGVFGDWDHLYLTMDFKYQAAIVRALGKFVEQGLVYKGKKPVHWCIHCRTALAEAEVEYEDHTSPVDLRRVPARAGERGRAGRARSRRSPGASVSVLIWTTTPWTIPSNLAIAFHPEVDYGAYEVDGRAVIVAEPLAAAVAQATGRTFGAPVARMKGAELEHIRFQHPLYARASVGVLADYVTVEQGTGAVHTAPGHGSDDFKTGVKYGLEIYAPVGPGGHFLQNVELFGGQARVRREPGGRGGAQGARPALASRAVSPHVPALLALPQPGHLPRDLAVVHRDGRAARARPVRRHRGRHVAHAAAGGSRRHRQPGPLGAADRPRSHPQHGREPARLVHLAPARVGRADPGGRLHGLRRSAADAGARRAAPRPCSTPTAPTPGTSDRSRSSCRTDSPARRAAAPASSARATSSTSGSTPARATRRCCRSGPELRWPADVYLEGSDQHRGWFQSSLLVGLGTRGRPPFNEVVTHGFIVAEDGRKMSKSLGNSIEPEDIIKESGAEIIRLWVTMVDYREEVRLGKQILARVVEAYRKIRNTCRYLLANLYDFDPGGRPRAARRDAGGRSLRAGALRRRGPVGARRLHAPTTFRPSSSASTSWRRSTSRPSTLTSRRTGSTRSRPPRAERRSAQTAMYVIADGLVRLLAPILPMTADELWRHLPGKRDASVHLAEFPADAEVDALLDADLVARWERLKSVRDVVNVALEAKRKDKTIGTSLGAQGDAAGGRRRRPPCSSSIAPSCRCCSSCRRSS